ncbi:hypothetical protein GYA25_00940 [Candidatus Woesearchaeota archaeon]|jgi:uncharacterized membrane protein (UPF0127 family)|nr:hypothetical protein [Candidatus Woesearchaeota archaeon]
MNKEIYLFYKNKKIKIKVKDCNFLEMSFGLMFSNKEKAKALLFEFKKERKIIIHSFFVFYPFLALWCDKKNKILEIKKVYPFSFTIIPKFSSKKLIEIPLNKKYKNYKKILQDFPSIRKI